MFFKYFPKTNYVIDGASFQIPDLFRRVAPNELVNRVTNLDYVLVRDGQTPESLSYDYYKTVDFYWTILLINEIIDPYHDWPKSAQDLYDWSIQKYGSAAKLREAHHYVYAGTGVKVDFDHNDGSSGTIVPVTNFAYESEENEKKRKVKLIKRTFIYEFSNQFQDLIQL